MVCCRSLFRAASRASAAGRAAHTRATPSAARRAASVAAFAHAGVHAVTPAASITARTPATAASSAAKVSASAARTEQAARATRCSRTDGGSAAPAAPAADPGQVWRRRRLPRRTGRPAQRLTDRPAACAARAARPRCIGCAQPAAAASPARTVGTGGLAADEGRRRDRTAATGVSRPQALTAGPSCARRSRSAEAARPASGPQQQGSAQAHRALPARAAQGARA